MKLTEEPVLRWLDFIGSEDDIASHQPGRATRHPAVEAARLRGKLRCVWSFGGLPIHATHTRYAWCWRSYKRAWLNRRTGPPPLSFLLTPPDQSPLCRWLLLLSAVAMAGVVARVKMHPPHPDARPLGPLSFLTRLPPPSTSEAERRLLGGGGLETELPLHLLLLGRLLTALGQ